MFSYVRRRADLATRLSCSSPRNNRSSSITRYSRTFLGKAIRKMLKRVLVTWSFTSCTAICHRRSVHRPKLNIEFFCDDLREF